MSVKKFFSDYSFVVFLALSVLFASCLAFLLFGDAIQNNYIVQDDFRQTNFWFWHFWDPSIFKNDLFTNNYKDAFNLAPLYLGIFKFAPALTDNLIAFSKYYAVILAILSAASAYLFYSAATKKNIEAFIFSALIAYMVWTTDHLSAAHVRSSIWLLLFLHLFLKYKKSDWWSGLLCGVSLFFNPCAFLLIYLAEFLPLFLDLKFKIKEYFIKYKTTVWFLTVNAVMTLTYHFVIRGGVSYTGKGQRLSVAEMKQMAEFNPGGRHPVFGANLWDNFGLSWWKSEHWGIGIGYLKISNIFLVALIAIAAYLIIKLLVKKNFNKEILTEPTTILFYSAIILNILAQVTFPLLYMPSRYLSIPLLLLACFTIFKIAKELLSHFIKELEGMDLKIDTALIKNIGLALVVGLLIYAFKDAIHPRFVSINPSIANIASNLPKDSLVAGFPPLPDINSLSIFSKRNVFVDYERSLSYTKSTLEEIRRRNFVALEMTFTTSKERFLELAKENGITHFLALLDLYSPQFLKSARYIKPYHRYMKQLIYDSKGQFYLARHLRERNLRYALIDISKLASD